VRVEWYESGQEPDYWYVDQAREQLDDARLNLDRIRQQGGVQAQDARNEVDRAEQAHLEAQDSLEQLLEPVDPKDIEAAELDIAAAELALQEAQDRLEEATLYAPFSGTVTTLDVEVGETVSAGEVLVVLATLDQLWARTVDLTELDVARVTGGRTAVVTVDALPDAEFEGRVASIDLQPEDYRGDVTYPVYVELDDAAPELRWGMTAMVEIEAQ
jgi:HlyD family secretion protein